VYDKLTAPFGNTAEGDEVLFEDLVK